MGRIDRDEAPVRLEPAGDDNFIGRTTGASHQNGRRGPRAQGCGQQAGRQIVAGFVASQSDTALLFIFGGAGRIEFRGGFGSHGLRSFGRQYTPVPRIDHTYRQTNF